MTTTATGLLDAKEHSRIIADFEQVCAIAGIQGHFLYESMTKHCGPQEVEWVKKFWRYRAEGCPGLALVGTLRPDTRCQSIASALVRNFVDARVIPVNSLLDSTMNGNHPPSPSVLLIPNLFMTAMGSGKNLPAWRIQAMYDLLLERSTRNKPTVVYVESMKGVQSAYGEPFRDFLSRFLMIED